MKLLRLLSAVYLFASVVVSSIWQDYTKAQYFVMLALFFWVVDTTES